VLSEHESLLSERNSLQALKRERASSLKGQRLSPGLEKKDGVGNKAAKKRGGEG